MISRRTAKLIAEFYASRFTRTYHPPRGNSRKVTHGAWVYDFLYENGYDAWFCNEGRSRDSTSGTRRLKDFVMRLHTGESLAEATPNWTWKHREKLGQRYLGNLAEDALQRWGNAKEYDKNQVAPVRRALELDGYEFKEDRLLAPEHDVVDAQEEAGVLRSLYKALQLEAESETFHFLETSDEHYIGEKWPDAISNSRKFLEVVLGAVATANARHFEQRQLPDGMRESPADVRDYLERQGLLEAKERKALSAVYSLLSHTGGHPYMAKQDQARLLRHLALTFSHFVMLRFRGRHEAAD